jgi:hypothetical protein
MLQLAYSGQVRQLTVTAASRIYYTLVGAGGGGGGSDSAGGTRGTSGDKLGGFIEVNANETLYVAVGGGGGAGASGGYAAGGAGGASLIGFTGGNGGNAGPWGSSGGGGGGGAATVLYKIVNGQRQIIAVASGGAGGGGGGNRVAGVFSGDSYLESSTASIPSTYLDAGSNGAWNSIGNDYGVWDSTYYQWAWANFTWAFNAPYTGNYTVRLSVDNYGGFFVNGTAVLYTPQDSRASNYNSYVETTFSMNAGLNILKLSGANSGGPAFLGALVYNNSGTLVWSSKSNPNISSAGGMGGDGQQHRYDGGGAGGGGGGHIGGRGGYVAGDLRYVNNIYGSGYFGYADWGAMSGSRGTSINYGITVAAGAGGGSMNNDYGTFGAASSNGTSGYAAFSSKTTSLSTYSGNWKTVSDVYIRQNNQWIEPKNVYVRQNDEWVNMYSNNVPAETTASSEPFIRSSWREVQFIEYPAPVYSYDA